MKFKFPLFFSMLLGAFALFAFYPKGDNPQKEQLLLETTLKAIKELHYSPRNLDDNFSKDLYRVYLERLDGGKRFLTQEEVDKLKPYQLLLDDQIRNLDLSFFNASSELLEKGVTRAEGIYKEILDSPFDFTVEESFETDADKRKFPANEAELKDVWRKMLKYETMVKLADKIEERTKGTPDYKDKTDKELEESARKSVKERFDTWFNQLSKLKRNEKYADFLNAIANLFDPHTEYYEPVEKQSFDIKFSGRLEGIGATLASDKEYTKVSDIMVGGPAWKQKELKTGDLILKVAQGDDEAVSIAGLNLNEVVSKIRGPKGTKVRLTVKSIDGSTKEIVIIRDEIILDEGYAKSVILDKKGVIDNIGFISLPKFYADFNKRDGRFCFQDVAKEVEKLKAANVNGIVIDLRNNGGGSLSDVVKMTGLFIEKGPIVQVKTREGRPDIQTDYDPQVQYTGPLVILVNNFSASASEIMAAALQDYGRAVIVGSDHTYGKGTVQRFIDLDAGVTGFQDMKPLGDVKISLQKFYRINGGSTQMRGVSSDIVLPDNLQNIELGEKESDFAMQWSQIDAVPYEQHAYKVQNLKELVKLSKERVSRNEMFNKINSNAKRVKEQRDASVYSLNLATFMKRQAELEKESEVYKKMFDKDVPDLEVKNIQSDLSYVNSDSTKIVRNSEFIKDMKKDIYVDESMNIIRDMIKQSLAVKN